MNFPIAPIQASNFAIEVDNIFLALTALTVFFTVVVLSVMLFLAVRYRRGSRYSRKGAVDEHLVLELSWSIGPLIIAIGMFLWAAKPFTEVYRPPSDAKEVFVIGKRWMWHLQHTNGIRENNELHIPVGRAVKLTMISQDVIHGFYVPAFRVKRDVLPGRFNTVWFEPTRPGRYHLFCSEYCGMNHSEMTGWVYVMDPADYQQWEASGGTRDTEQNESMASAGEKLYNTLGCGNCHGATNNVHGPTLYGLFGKVRQFTDGSSTVADDNYLRSSLINPNAQVVTGYQNIMPAYPIGSLPGQMSEEQTLALIAYMKTLGATAPGIASPAIPGNKPPSAHNVGPKSGGKGTASSARKSAAPTIGVAPNGVHVGVR